MAIHGFTREKRQQLIKEIAKFIKGNRNLDKEAWAWYDIPSSMFGTHNSYMVMLDWQEGYDEDEHTEFVQDGYGLNVTIRVNHDQYFAYDNPYPICNKYGDVVDGFTLSENDIKDDFVTVANDVIHLLKTALSVDDMNVKGLDIDEQEQLFKIQEDLNLNIGDKISVADYDDEDLMDVIEERGSNEFTVSDYSYYDGTVWVEECDYGIDMQYVSNLSMSTVD